MFNLRRSLFRAIFAVILFATASTLFSSSAQQPKPAQSDPIRALLDLPAPLPESAYDYADPWDREKKPPIPDHDAPIELLIKYWTRPGLHSLDQSSPNEKVKLRFLDAIEKDPELIPDFLLWDLLPNTLEAHDRVKAWIDGRRPATDDDPGSLPEKSDQERAREWLMTHSHYLRDELIRNASDPNETKAYIHSERFLIALAGLDWEKASPVLERHVTSNSPKRAALAFSLQYTHAVETRDAALESSLRERLQTIVADRQAPAYARAKACEALLKAEWPGRDEWYLSQFSDESLREMEDGRDLLRPLATPLNTDPDKWIPVVTQLVGNPNRTIHDAAVAALMQINSWKPRRETILPLLPWLFDQKWSSASDREQLLQNLMGVQAPECVPGLIAIIENEEDYPFLQTAVRAISCYYAPQAAAALKQASKKGDTYDLSVAIVACGALSDEEMIEYLEKYALHINRFSADSGLDYQSLGGDFDSFEWEIGSRLSEPEYAPMHLAARLLDRVEELQAEKPDLAAKLMSVIQRWPAPVIFQNIVERIADGTADRLAIGQALLHREKLRGVVTDKLQQIMNKGGRGAGIAVVLLNDRASQVEILNGKDREAQMALLACARLTREHLPVDAVGRLYKLKDSRMSLAVDRYLESEDSVEARRLILGRHPGEAMILGAIWSFNPRPRGEIFRWEEKLREEVKRQDGSKEIFAMAVGAPEIYRSMVIHVRNGKAFAVKASDESREEYRELTDQEWQEAGDLFNSVEFDDLPPLIRVPPSDEIGHNTPSHTVFAHVRSSGGRRVFTNTVTEDSKGNTAHQRLYNLFSALAKSDGFKVRYKLEDHINGLEVLYADDENPAQNVCMQDHEARILVKEDLIDEQEKPLRTRKSARPQAWRWRTLQNGKIGEITQEPAACPVTSFEEQYDKEFGGNRDETFRAPWQLRNGDEMIRVGYQNDSQSLNPGVWKLKPGREPERIAEGGYGWPLVTRDGKWLIATQYGKSAEKKLNTIVRFDLRTNQSLKTKFSSEDYVQAVAEIAPLGKVLIVRPDNSSSRLPEGDFYLLDPATGATELVKGEFRPLQQQTYRPLQPVAGSTEYWAAIPDEKQNRTQIGRYDAKRFVFKPLMDLPEIKFYSMGMWVDEAANHVYVTYNGHLLRMPLTRRRPL